MGYRYSSKRVLRLHNTIERNTPQHLLDQVVLSMDGIDSHMEPP